MFSTMRAKKKCLLNGNTSFGPSVEIRTQGLLNPIQARYQTSPHPDILLSARQLTYITTSFFVLQPLIFDFFIFSFDVLLFVDKAQPAW